MSTYTEETVLDQITAQWLDAYPGDPTADPPIQPTKAHYVILVRRSNRILKDGRIIADRKHRHVVELDDKLKDEDPIVQRIAKALRG